MIFERFRKFSMKNRIKGLASIKNPVIIIIDINQIFLFVSCLFVLITFGTLEISASNS